MHDNLIVLIQDKASYIGTSFNRIRHTTIKLPSSYVQIGEYAHKSGKNMVNQRSFFLNKDLM